MATTTTATTTTTTTNPVTTTTASTAASVPSVEEFLNGPLVTWLSTCVKNPETLQIYETFFDGGPFVEVLLQIDPEPIQPIPTLNNLKGYQLTTLRTNIFHCIVRNIRTIYEEELGQMIITQPDCIILGRTPGSELALEQFQLLLLLLLGCAVQGPTKEYFITKIKDLSVNDQHEIVNCIKKITDDQCIVISNNIITEIDCNEREITQHLYTHLRRLITERDKLLQQWIDDLHNKDDDSSNNKTPIVTKPICEGYESNHLAVELADWKSRLRKQRQELDEKTELLTECREELEHANTLIIKLKNENNELLIEARHAKIYRDEIDILRERVERTERLEYEIQRYRERLTDAEFYKIRVDELREDIRVLIETREMLEQQLLNNRQRADRALELESELFNFKQKFNELLIEHDADKGKIQELIDENLQLQQLTKSALQETSAITNQSSDDEDEDGDNCDVSLSEQLTTNIQARVLRLELENKKLSTIIEKLKENNYEENCNKLLELEKEKKRLLLKNEQLEENYQRLQQQNTELEQLFKNAIQENRKLQDNLDQLRTISDRQLQDLQNERSKIADLEKNCENLTKEKQHIQILFDTNRKRADDGEKQLNKLNEQLTDLYGDLEKYKKFELLSNELQEKINGLEKDYSSAQREINKFKELLECKDVVLDGNLEKLQRQDREIQRLFKQIEQIQLQNDKLQEIDKKAQDLSSQITILNETITTLQNDLILTKITNEKYKNNLDKLCLNLDFLEDTNDLHLILQRLLDNPEIVKIVTNLIDSRDKTDDDRDRKVISNDTKLLNEITNLQQLNQLLQTENAKMQVDISTLKSTIQSLQTQQSVLQLANSQLVAEKDELNQKQLVKNNQHDTLLNDQKMLQLLHEQLTQEYEQLKIDDDYLKRQNRELKTEIRVLKENNQNCDDKIKLIENELSMLKNDSKNLGILRAEHSKLKDDFRNLFTASERLKLEYRSAQDELKSMKIESRTLRLGQTEMQGELNTRSDLVAGLQLENARLQQKCDMLFEMNHNLDSDRRALMDHVSQLLSQYHSLLTHSLEDKQHYHLEEKLYADKVNNLCRQKEKLEEKIMEHYRKLENASVKKKSFGATLVRRVRKAGSDIINKVPTTRNRRSWHEDATRLTTSTSHISGGGGSGESAGNDSDNSLDDLNNRIDQLKRSSIHGYKPKDEIALRRSQRDTSTPTKTPTNNSNSGGGGGDNNNSALSLGSIGSRRTVYLSEEEPNSTSTQFNNNQTKETPPPPPPQQQPPLLVYNRISTVIGDQSVPQRPETTATPQVLNNNNNSNNNNNDRRKIENSKETAVWYEYGCV